MAEQAKLAGWLETGRQFRRVAGGYWRERETRRHALLLALGLVCLICLEVALLLRFNTWNRDLFDALERRDTHGVLVQAALLVLIVGGMCVASAGQMLARRRIALGWRTWLARRLTAVWLASGGLGPPNSDGRIAEDARIATEEMVELAASLFHATLTSASFIGVLWALSDHPPIMVLNMPFSVPGYLLWLALLYAAAGMAVAVLAGRPLIRATDHRQACEADYRAALVRTRDEGRYGIESGLLLGRLFGHLGAAFERQTRAVAWLEFFVAAVVRLGLGLPFLVATPAYLAGVASLGWLMQAAQAFQTVAGAMGWPVANMPRLATWRASAERVIAMAATAPAGQVPAALETALARPTPTV
jgi:putative ATP-binding cassette transporter